MLVFQDRRSLKTRMACASFSFDVNSDLPIPGSVHETTHEPQPQNSDIQMTADMNQGMLLKIYQPSRGLKALYLC